MEQFHEWKLKEYFPAWRDALQNQKISIAIGFNGIGPYPDKDSYPAYKWVSKNVSNYGMKLTDRNARGTHLHNERQSILWCKLSLC